VCRPGSCWTVQFREVGGSPNSLYIAEMIRGPGRGPWRTIEDV